MSLRPEIFHRWRTATHSRCSPRCEATTTCVDRTERCIGRQYDFSPFISAKLVITAGKNVTGRRRAVSLASQSRSIAVSGVRTMATTAC